MSCTLYARKKVKSEWPWALKGSLRDTLRHRYPSGIESGQVQAIAYLEGVRDTTRDDDEALALQEIVEALNSGEDIEFDYQC